MQSEYSKPYSCIIIDDDQISIDMLNGYISRMKEVTVTATYTDPIAGIKAIQGDGKIDILFLDIAMEVSGLDVARLIRDQVRYLVFVTSYEKYALDAFRVYADKFLVKPVSPDNIQFVIADLVKRDRR